MTENTNHDSNIMVEKRKDSLIITCPSCGHHIKSQDQGGIIPELPGLPAGVKFDPSDQEILEHLEAKVRSDIHKLHPLIDDFIPTLEGENGICYTHPEKLPGVRKDGMVRHFFHRPSKAYTTGTRKRRKVMTPSDDVEAGTETRWHKTGKTRAVLKNTNMKKVIGHKKILVLYTNYGKQRKPEKTNWVMHQYHLGFNEDEKEGELVVSKVFYQTQPRHCGSTNFNNNNHDDSLLHLHHHHHHSKSSSNNGSFVDHYYNGNSSFLSFDQVVGQHRSSSTNNSQVMSTSSFIP